MEVSLLIPAAGNGERLGLGPKAFLRVGGRTLLEWALRAFPGAAEVLVALPPGAEAPRGLRAVFLEGGKTRQESVARLLEAASLPLVLVHDVARPFASTLLVERVLRAAQATGAAAPVLPLPDTLVRPEGEAYGEVVPREALRLVQTPQGFFTALLREAHAYAKRRGLTATDDAQLVRALGYPVALVAGERTAFKITYPEDLLLAEALARVWNA
ncbi:2-C-methyl-D-erythritol 4-phosphate cytidylyltransferase [Thermus thermamylovorans]|uniref:2-C-methyl-D-erythritol 4-phosphate cytidylyltransferase n=1 Tax=Thermus thermamylovorans TaxID=2509362 RepID=A0A4Q9B589_9DEIN|nr:2-C-methyl-D-erythritol 4-phosphate cytidylyltransferase [Thermus thermamylovorans]TBH20763.1 2-C-methyl-D-erythritol 4-phosphate cytidylyltransferase [Thermus thermamylovorans]